MITHPVLILDEAKCRENIRQMAQKAKVHGLRFRPHFKTHQSLEIGRWFQDMGVSGITVSSLEMAAYFASEWDDITVAFPVNLLEIGTINRLARKIRLQLLIESAEAVHFLGQHLKAAVGFFIKTDTGYHRTGIDSQNTAAIEAVIEAAARYPLLSFKGFLTHNGHTYKCRKPEDVEAIHRHSLKELVRLKSAYSAQYPNLIISLGDTPSCSICNDFDGIDEIRPGNFVFYDLTQVAIGSCQPGQIAVALACPVVALHPERDEMVIYGGGVHLSKDFLPTPSGVSYGQLAHPTEKGWGAPVEGVWIKSLSQEHGIVHLPSALQSSYKVGDWVYVLPIHSCMTANLMKNFLSLSGNKIGMMPPLG